LPKDKSRIQIGPDQLLPVQIKRKPNWLLRARWNDRKFSFWNKYQHLTAWTWP